MSQRWRNRALVIALATVSAQAVPACGARDPMKRPSRPPALGANEGRAPAGVRIKVEVLNATRSRGLGRRAALYLRDRGYDVVLMGNSGRTQDSTTVLDRSRHPEWARLIAAAMRARIVERPDTSRYLDATVLVGSDWSPPADLFYP